VVELGAWDGEDFEGLVNKPILHIMVEPDPRNIKRILSSPSPLTSDRKLIQGAVARESGFRKFHFSDGSLQHGSLLEPTGHLKQWPHISFPHVETVACYTLDEIFLKESLSRIDLLWADVQGAEGEMIEGGWKALQKTQYCMLESEEVEIYKGEVLKPELIKMLEGWELIQEFHQDFTTFNILLRNRRFNESAN
jgi:FkbM family methyltransferase